MKEFHVRDYLKNKEFMNIVLSVISSTTGDEIKSNLLKLDELVSKICELPTSTFIYDDNYDKLGKFNFDNTIILTGRFLTNKKMNIDLIAVYLHEKRHFLQYMCYKNDDKLLGEEILEDVRVYFSREDATAITGKTTYSGLYGYFNMPIENDAHVYEYSEIIDLLKWVRLHYIVNADVDGRLNYYLDCLDSFNDPEYLAYVEQGQEEYKVRLLVEEKLLLEIKKSIANNEYSKDIRKMLFSKRVYEKLNDDEKKVLDELLKGSKEKHVLMSEKYLDKYIDKEIKRVIKEKRLR